MFTRFRSMTATAMAAALGCALVATAPAAMAQKNKKEEAKKGSSINPSKGFTPAVKKMIDASNAKDAAALEAAIAEGQGTASTAEDRYWLAYYELQLGIQKKDQVLQGKGLDAMIDSGLAPADGLAAYNFYSGNFAYGDKNYAKTVQRLEAAKAAGSAEPQLDVLLMDSYLQLGQVDQGIALAKAAIEARRAAGQRPSDELYVRPIRALQTAKRNEEVLDLMTLRMRDYNQPEVWRQTLFTLLQQSGENKEIALDTLRLMRATGAMLQRPEYLEYAGLATEAALPGEVVALIKAGKASNVIPQADARLDEIAKAQAERIGDEESTLTAYAARPQTLSNPRVAGATGDAMVGYGRYADAVPLYKAALAAGGDKELWTYRLGVAQALAGDAAGAKASFAEVSGARKRLAQLWTVKLDSAVAPAPAAATTS
ncbi:MAG TPA: tetratricopeptide repeat protein [Sphingopyxis sp.]|nr:tetratricopeptide repeat protein [Sphingopyxis sp.]HMP45847.1 tetratricopeptide repeat protein [Sphingopyxis sp.]HMQ18285.1 tetratricopeptide repeat protein [Sphingopyxis sp.]